MDIRNEIENMKSIQCAVLKFIEEETNTEENYKNLINLIRDQKIKEDRHKVKSMLRLINNISNNHQRVSDFINKIEQILTYFKTEIVKYFKQSEIFQIFENNKRILLFLIQENIIIIDEYIVSEITSENKFKKKYPEYFSPEIKSFLTEEFINKYKKRNPYLQNNEIIQEIQKEKAKEFYELREKGENDNYLCELIRLNDVKTFGVYVNRNNISLECFIKESIFETNPILLDKSNIKLIEYASFYGSNSIIKYMIANECNLTSNMWKYSIHSQNEELIKYLEDNDVLPPNKDYKIILKESIKCHHNDVSNYIISNLIDEEDLKDSLENGNGINYYKCSVEFHNYYFFPENIEYKYMFFYLCGYDYYILVDLYLKNQNIDINEKTI